MAFKRIIEVASGPQGQAATTFSQCKIEFEIKRDKTKTPNKAEVTLYNLSDDTMAKMGKRDNKLIIRAGYADEGGPSAIFYGDVTKSEIIPEEQNKLLKIEAMDGYKNIQGKNISLSYAKGTRISTVLDDILNVMAYPVAGNKPSTSDVYAKGYTFIGKAQDALTQVLKKLNYKWTIQNEQIFMYQEGEGVVKYGLKLTSQTGLLSISKVEQDIATKDKGKKVPVCYNIETLLFPQIIPGAIVRIESSQATGNMVVESCTMSGDNFDGDFKVEAEVRAI
jgi:hypothetical protein